MSHSSSCKPSKVNSGGHKNKTRRQEGVLLSSPALVIKYPDSKGERAYSVHNLRVYSIMAGKTRHQERNQLVILHAQFISEHDGLIHAANTQLTFSTLLQAMITCLGNGATHNRQFFLLELM